MKIALVVPGGVDRSGEYRVVPALLGLITRLARAHDVSVFALRQEPRAASWRLCGARVFNLGRPLPELRLFGAIRREHAQAPYDVIQAIWGGRGAWSAICAGRSIDVPVAVHLAGGELAALPEIAYGGRLRWTGRAVVDRVLRQADAVTAASAPMIDTAARHHAHADRIPLGVDLATWPPLEPRPRDEAMPIRLVHIASLNLVKDQETLLRAVARFATAGLDFRLDVVGEDTLHGRVQALARQLGVGARVTFHGFLTQRQMRPIVEAAHINLVSSRHEAGPLAALEAAVVGIPTVGTAVGHLCEWAPRAALTVPVGDADAMAAAILSLASDETLRLAVARAAASIAIAEDADFTAAAFLAQYTRLAGHPG